uniref:Uncharacterized protein n=1 Tax=Chromera velia CCMP2878 TaxID=1169474 RepID=A0A0G4HQE0_9ALVE|eukprot:Cvel_7921.t1-p1 / transcript=Cvel_7921.t1 / gene=Cvel_7921 / organism=Chromera_velia_CCMP2878 / gene_product=Serine/threonine-protein phosphatase 6 regulatory, putative / transcript_product=Serine/threonine-protein phosphatase 6 regulatory, putative / location=Cvel_scaffold424:82320-83679(-) / protein_length=189 / sequence_SO=supercontig / SO=protein_coding / is_pseudo=false
MKRLATTMLKIQQERQDSDEKKKTSKRPKEERVRFATTTYDMETYEVMCRGDVDMVFPDSDENLFDLTEAILVNVRKFKPVSSAALCEAIKKRNFDDVLLLLRLGSHIHGYGGKEERVAIYWAAESEDLRITKTLVAFGASLERHRISPLNVAYSRGHLPVIKFLARNISDLNQYDTSGDTPLIDSSIF